MIKKPIILIGFKNTGKSTIGKALSKRLNLDFIDLDNRVEENYQAQTGKNLTAYQISVQKSVEYFRQLETQAIKSLAFDHAFILATGGGAILSAENQSLLSAGTFIKINSPKGLTFERIMLQGRPAFFPKDEDPYTAFAKIWEEREPIYNRLAAFSIKNERSIEEAVDDIIMHLKKDELL